MTPKEIGIRRHLDVIERVTGTRPQTCPWRAMYHPLVREVKALSKHYESGNLASFIDADPPGILLDGLAVYRASLDAVRAEDEKLRLLKAEQERKARGAR